MNKCIILCLDKRMDRSRRELGSSKNHNVSAKGGRRPSGTAKRAVRGGERGRLGLPNGLSRGAKRGMTHGQGGICKPFSGRLQFAATGPAQPPLPYRFTRLSHDGMAMGSAQRQLFCLTSENFRKNIWWLKKNSVPLHRNSEMNGKQQCWLRSSTE